MSHTVTVYLYGKAYEVPENLTIMTAIEYIGKQLVHGCGCRNGFCGACATVYRIDGQVKTALACETPVIDGMIVESTPIIATKNPRYDITDLEPLDTAIKRIFPEIDHCISCNACTRNCVRGLNVSRYIAYARKGNLQKCAEESFACVSCGLCTLRCPAKISHPEVALLARRIYGAYLQAESNQLFERLSEARNGDFDAPIKKLIGLPKDELKRLYQNRDIET